MNRCATIAFTARTVINSVITMQGGSDKNSAMAELADALPKRLMAFGVSDVNAYKVVENTTHDARRLGPAIYGGHIGTAFRVELY
jgi:hypothetical protein